MSEEKSPWEGVGPWTFRLHMGRGSKAKGVPWIQRQRWLWFWVDWYPVHNRRRWMMLEVIDLWHHIQELNRNIELAKSEPDRAVAVIDEFNPSKGVSKPFGGPRRPREADIPDPEKEYKAVLEEIQKGGARRRPHGGTVTGYHLPRDGGKTTIFGEDEVDHLMAFDHNKGKKGGGQDGLSNKERSRLNHLQQKTDLSDEEQRQLDALKKKQSGGSD